MDGFKLHTTNVIQKLLSFLDSDLEDITLHSVFHIDHYLFAIDFIR